MFSQVQHFQVSHFHLQVIRPISQTTSPLEHLLLYPVYFLQNDLLVVSAIYTPLLNYPVLTCMYLEHNPIILK